MIKLYSHYRKPVVCDFCKELILSSRKGEEYEAYYLVNFNEHKPFNILLDDEKAQNKMCNKCFNKLSRKKRNADKCKTIDAFTGEEW